MDAYLSTWTTHIVKKTLADPAVGFRGGQLGARSQPRVPPPKKNTQKTDNSTDLTNHFLGWTQIKFTFEKKLF